MHPTSPPPPTFREDIRTSAHTLRCRSRAGEITIRNASNGEVIGASIGGVVCVAATAFSALAWIGVAVAAFFLVVYVLRFFARITIDFHANTIRFSNGDAWPIDAVCAIALAPKKPATPELAAKLARSKGSVIGIGWRVCLVAKADANAALGPGKKFPLDVPADPAVFAVSPLADIDAGFFVADAKPENPADTREVIGELVAGGAREVNDEHDFLPLYRIARRLSIALNVPMIDMAGCQIHAPDTLAAPLISRMHTDALPMLGAMPKGLSASRKRSRAVLKFDGGQYLGLVFSAAFIGLIGLALVVVSFANGAWFGMLAGLAICMFALAMILIGPRRLEVLDGRILRVRGTHLDPPTVHLASIVALIAVTSPMPRLWVVTDRKANPLPEHRTYPPWQRRWILAQIAALAHEQAVVGDVPADLVLPPLTLPS